MVILEVTEDGKPAPEGNENGSTTMPGM